MSLDIGDGLTLTLTAADDGDVVAPLFSDVWLGTEIWPAARVLVDYLKQEEQRRRLTASAVVLELGSGTGACGLAAAALGAQRVVLTDKASLVPAMRQNIAANEHLCSGDSQVISCTALEWSDNMAPLAGLEEGADGADIVLMSDCLNPVYGETHAVALAATLHALLVGAGRRRREGATARDAMASTLEPVGYLSQTRRGEGVAEAAFFEACERYGLQSTVVYTTAHDGASQGRQVSPGEKRQTQPWTHERMQPPLAATQDVTIHAVTLGARPSQAADGGGGAILAAHAGSAQHVTAQAAFGDWLAALEERVGGHAEQIEGMEFGAHSAWWGERKPRQRAHEGVDVYSFHAVEDGLAGRTIEGVPLIVIEGGECVAVFPDFLGHTAIVRRPQQMPKEVAAGDGLDCVERPELLWCYAHMALDSKVVAGCHLRPGDILGRVRERGHGGGRGGGVAWGGGGGSATSSTCPPHLHVSLLQADPAPHAHPGPRPKEDGRVRWDQINWRNIHDASTLCFLPLVVPTARASRAPSEQS
jgi:hypothetical protein